MSTASVALKNVETLQKW